MTEQTNAYFRALEQASNESPITDGKHRAYIAWFNSFRNQSSAFEVDDLPWPRDIHEFVETIRAAGVTEFAVTDRSTGLMEGLHKLAVEGCTMQGLCKVTRHDRWNSEGLTEYDGILFRI